MSPAIRQHPLSYTRRLAQRSTEHIKLVVIHCTELPDLAMARTWGEKVLYPESQTGNSGHFYIDRDGSIEEWTPIDRIAHHVRGYNPASIGIELVNIGRYPDWFKSGHQQMSEPYPALQIEALVNLLAQLVEELPGLDSITGHEDLDTDVLPSEDDSGILIRRKVDPGPLFPWSVIMNQTSLKRLSFQNL